MSNSFKKFIGCMALIIFVLGYCVAIATVAGLVIAEQHWAIQIAFFIFAGVIWAPVIKPLMIWMRKL